MNNFLNIVLFEDNSTDILNSVATKASSIGYVILSSFSGLVALILMFALIYTGIKIAYSHGQKRKQYIIHIMIVFVVFIITIILFSIGIKYAVDISTKAAINLTN
ncbi:Mbov_0395 family pilin-like conjugal transfer protein [Mesomycoplasma hyorhinis]|uniref:Uncharacterized protein n=4 Tax=Mesomycoplasma hyorhinis TaxID=2100 RepID=A0AAJ3D7K5_MESHY|nr:hypothetical protein [Mesomycoplasma hyorhinis]AEC46232.1 hypothetical protein SRH_03460 [Mesomycoplasma hyorhinis MCLD]AEX14259.1 hypothetical protein MYM_0508 [Mesomycoplasma hyorhinis GDL-1]AFX74457.1 hypothetical protein MOS_545 [Mesomycoplasma hyorhinis SK76]AHA41266.1 hypothetical protein Q453_0548 [Mesomycoplasma hyorhinis DBS 1050]TRM74494.1 hypothetical protein DJ532_12695 [Sulfolobus sp. A20-N-F8]TRM83622.1 hypothetical protein DJ531_04580 [Sulfolobus sp. A20-N-F6]CRH25387.1 Unc